MIGEFNAPIKVVSNRSGWLARASAQDIPAEPAPTTSTLFFADLDGIVSGGYEYSTMYRERMDASI